MGVNVSFYIPVPDAATAARALEVELGFFPSALGLEDPAPAVLGEPSELVRKHLCRAFVAALDSTAAGPCLRYWTFDRWPMTSTERLASMAIVARVEQVCRTVGAGAYVCLPDSATIDDLPAAALPSATHRLGADDPDVVFAE